MPDYPQIKLFGAPALTWDGRRITGFISNKAVAALYFTAATGQPQARDVLATLLWTNSDDRYAKKNLRNVLSNLRDRLGSFVEINRETVSLAPTLYASVDSNRFTVLLKQAEQFAPSAPQRRALLAEAVTLYQGPFLDGFHVADAEAFEEWLRSEREHFGLLAIQAFHALVLDSQQQRNFLEGINYATLLLKLDPLRAETQRQLMVLLALDGQANAAVAQYRTYQTLLRNELGIDLDPETKALYQRIQAGEFHRADTVSVTSKADRPASVTRPVSLPAELTGFVGRETEIAQVQQRLADPICRLLTITGMGGVGKTRLALHAGHLMAEHIVNDQLAQFQDGIYFVSLAALEPRTQIEHLCATTLATALGIPLAGAATPITQLIQALDEKALLLILDNCEHLPVAPFITQLLQQTRHLKLLVTSRTRLNVRGEQLFQLDGLTMPELTAARQTQLSNYSAIRLFVQSVTAILPDFVLDEQTAGPVTRICRLLHGLPLGIELAATWARLLPLAEIAQEIQQNLDFLHDTQFEALPHQRSLRAVFNHSWQLLAPDEQQALRRLAVFHGGFTREAAFKVAGATLPLLAALNEKSLLHRAAPTANVHGVPDSTMRYELQALMRQYASEQLTQAGERQELEERHAAYMSEFLAARRTNLQSFRQQEALRELHDEIDNVRAAWQWLLAHLQTTQADLAQIEHQVGQAFDSLFHFYDMRSWFQEGEEVFGHLARQLPMMSADQTNAAGPSMALWRLQAKAQARQAWFAFHLGRYRESRGLFEQSLHHLQQLDATAETVFNLNYLGALLRHLGDFAEAEPYLQAALRAAQGQNDRLGASIALNTLGQVAFLQGNYAETQNLCSQALAIKQAIGDRWGMIYSLTSLGLVAQTTGEYAAAQKLFDESLAICRAIGDQRGAASALQNLGDTAYRSGHLAIAQTYYQESLHIYRGIGTRAEASLLLTRLGEVATAGGRYSDAKGHLHEALALAWAVRATPGLLAALLGLGALALATGQPAQAVAPLQLVYQHAASSHIQKARAAQLLADRTITPFPSPAGLDLATYVQGQLVG